MHENTTDMLALAEKIAGEMGDEWTAAEGVWSNVQDAKLIGPEGVELHLTTGRYHIGNGRMQANGWLPNGWHEYTPSKYDETAPQDPGDITMTLSKSPAVMARDILRRLVPAFTAYYVATRDRKNARDAAELDTATFGDELVASAPGAEWRWSRRESGRHGRFESPAEHPARTDFSVGRYGDRIRAEVRLTGDGAAVELDMRDRDDVRALVEWIAARRAGGAS